MKKVIMTSGLAAILALSLTACGSSNSAPAATQSSTSSTNTSNPNKGNHQNKPKFKANPMAGLVRNNELLHLLKIDPITLQDDLKTGESIVDVGKKQGVTEDQIISLLVQQRSDALKKKGKTDDEINQMKPKWTTQIKKIIEKKIQNNTTATK